MLFKNYCSSVACLLDTYLPNSDIYQGTGALKES